MAAEGAVAPEVAVAGAAGDGRVAVGLQNRRGLVQLPAVQTSRGLKGWLYVQ